jgi:hypothetical protein
MHVAQIGRQDREFALRIEMGAIPADECPCREAVSVMPISA